MTYLSPCFVLLHLVFYPLVHSALEDMLIKKYVKIQVHVLGYFVVHVLQFIF